MNRLKNAISLFLYGIKLRVINIPFLVINILLLVYALLDIEALMQKEFWVFIILLFINIIWQTFSTLYDTITLFCSTGHYIDKIESSSEVVAQNIPYLYIQYTNREFNVNIIYSTKVNDVLLGEQPIQIINSPRHKVRVENYIDQNKGLLLLFLKAKWHQKKDGGFFNESKLCQASEFCESSRGIQVKVSKGCYYNTFITNDIYTLQLHHQVGLTLYPPLNITTTPIKPLDQSMFGNHIGVSTIVVTQDGKMIILQHNDKSAVSANMYAPGGSGSVDYGDWKQQDIDFRQILIRAMQREFSEETGIKEDFISRTEIIGAFRNIDRGGKPEYCGITYLNITAFEAEELFKAEKKEMQDNSLKTIQLFNADGEIYLSEFEKFIAKHQRLISMALYVCIFFLKRYLNVSSEQEKLS